MKKLPDRIKQETEEMIFKIRRIRGNMRSIKWWNKK